MLNNYLVFSIFLLNYCRVVDYKIFSLRRISERYSNKFTLSKYFLPCKHVNESKTFLRNSSLDKKMAQYLLEHWLVKTALIFYEKHKFLKICLFVEKLCSKWTTTIMPFVFEMLFHFIIKCIKFEFLFKFTLIAFLIQKLRHFFIKRILFSKLCRVSYI